MIRRIAKLALILFAIANIAATCKGTETGNPGVPSDNPDGGGTGGGGTTTGGETGCSALKAQASPGSPGSDDVVDDLILALCNKIILCGVATTTDTCFNALNGADGDRMTDEFGLPEGTFTVTQLREALIDGDFSAAAAAASTCEASIGSVDCAVVSANVSSGDFSRTEEIVPAECAAVFGAVGADGSPVVNCP